MKKYTADASAVLNQLLPDEEPSEAVKGVFEGFANKRAIIISPSLLKIEVGNALKVAVLRKRYDKPTVREIYKRFLLLGIDYQEINYLKVLEISFHSDTSFYDACYLYIAQKNRAELVSLDKKLKEKVNRS